jgi:hypothetical protein
MTKYIGEKFRIPYPKTKAEQKQWSKDYGMNAYYAGKHWSIRKRDADFWHMLVKSCLDGQEVRRTPFKRPVVITFWFNDRLDCSNHGVMIKMIEDGMKGRLIQDDSRKYVKGIECYFHDDDYIKVEVREIG